MRLFLFILILTTLLAIGCSAPSELSSVEGDHKTTLKDLEPVVEARQFFADPNCVAWTEGVPVSELKRFCVDMYRAGAARVLFANAEPLEGKKVSALFVVELPKDKSARDRCIQAWNKELADSDFEVKSGEDLDYLEMSMD